MGGSVPGKAFEQVNYAGGIPKYKDEIRAALKDWTGFEVVKGPQGAGVRDEVQNLVPEVEQPGAQIDPVKAEVAVGV